MTTLILSQTAARSPFVSVAALRQQIAAGSTPVLLFVHDADSAPEGLIPGSRVTQLATHYAQPGDPQRGRLPLPERHRVLAWLAEEGIDPASPIVVYDAGSSTQAARAWWTLSWAGCSQVLILDGGLNAWRNSDAAVPGEHGAVAAQATDHAREFISIDTDEIVRKLGTVRLIDARGSKAFEGDGQAPSHLPGAENIPATSWQDSEGRLLPREERLKRAHAAGLLESEQPVVAYCGSGVAASYWIAATVDLNVKAALYAGSWSAWSADPTRLKLGT